VCWWLTLVILATQEAEIRGLWFKASLGKQFERHYLKKIPKPKKAGRVAQCVDPVTQKKSGAGVDLATEMGKNLVTGRTTFRRQGCLRLSNQERGSLTAPRGNQPIPSL
jgi:hypothetical protein